MDGSRLIVLGQSLGGATALRLLALDSEGVRLAVIEASFASYRGIARDAARQSVVLAPLVPIAAPLLPGALADPVAVIGALQVPLLIVHGTADEVIPIKHSEQLVAAAPPGARFLRIEGARHMESLSRADVQATVLEAMVIAVR